MKALSIGRDQSCDIVINDSTDVISRRHAILNISSLGKMTIVDLSRNGTYVNGIRITPNVQVPITRKDVISLAHVAKLDWNLVPLSYSIMRYVILGCVALLLLICAYFAYQHYIDKPKAVNEDVEIVAKQPEDEKSKGQPNDSVNGKSEDEQLPDTIEQKVEEKRPAKKVKEPSRKKEKQPEVKKDSVKNNRSIG